MRPLLSTKKFNYTFRPSLTGLLFPKPEFANVTEKLRLA
jgi:hypothetical protein